MWKRWGFGKFVGWVNNNEESESIGRCIRQRADNPWTSYHQRSNRYCLRFKRIHINNGLLCLPSGLQLSINTFVICSNFASFFSILRQYITWQIPNCCCCFCYCCCCRCFCVFPIGPTVLKSKWRLKLWVSYKPVRLGGNGEWFSHSR